MIFSLFLKYWNGFQSRHQRGTASGGATKSLPTLSIGSSLKELFGFFKMMGVKPYLFYISIVCTIAAGFFNLFGMRLLFALVNGIIRGNYNNVSDKFGIFRRLVRLFPNGFQETSSYFLLLIGFIYASVLVKSLLQFVATYTVDRETRRANLIVKDKIFSRYLGFGKLYFDRTPVGRVNHIILTAAESLTRQLNVVQQFATEIITFVVYLGIMIWISWKLTLLAFIIFPFFNAFTNRFRQSVRDASLRLDEARETMNVGLFDIVSCITLVKSQGTAKREFERFKRQNEEESDLNFKTQTKLHLLDPLQEISGMTALLIIAGITTFLSPGTGPQKTTYLIIFFFLLRRSIPSFQIFYRIQLSLAGSVRVIEQMKEICSDDEKFMVSEGTEIFPGFHDAIDIKDLNFSYPRRGLPALSDISLKIEKGRVTAIVGPTGAGKSTLVNLLMRFYECPKGTIFIDGKDITEFKIQSLVDRMAYVGQEPLLFNNTLRVNIAYGLEDRFSANDLEEAIKRAQLHEFIESLPDKLDTIIGNRGVELSGGERQRVSIARAFLKKAEIVLLDEATSALDSKTERLIQKALDEIKKGRTVVAIAHRLSTVRNADKIVVIEKGRLCEEGSPTELLAKKGKFWEYWEAQQFYDTNEDRKQ